ncbi:hypothetical protein NPIL_419681 [Nephila pilipes]|uniref:Alpha-latrotoxin n=1 Tax=Nephila pilipes TaxID=299642 RepID=A0A8X6QBU5_NEPPI|nr:hypothetical protein NPIL_419681 [Nephila pilipes]
MSFQIPQLIRNGDLGGLKNALQNEALSDKSGYNLVCLAVTEDRQDMVEELLQHGCRVTDEGTDNFISSPVSIAVSKGNFEMVDLLVSHGADQMTAMFLMPEHALRSGDELDELIIRVKSGWLQGVRELLETVRIPDDLKYEIVRLAVVLSRVDIVKELLNHGCKVVDEEYKDLIHTPLRIAIFRKDFEMINLLTKYRPDVMTAFCFVPNKVLLSGDNIDKLLYLIREGKVEEVRKLLPKVTLEEHIGYQIVRLAVIYGRFQIVEELVRYGCKVSIENTRGINGTPLQIAISKGYLEMADFLVSNGADILVAFCSVPDDVLEVGDAIDKLVVRVRHGKLQAVKRLLESIELTDFMGYQMIRLAVTYKRILIVIQLLKRGCKVNIKNRSHQTPLDIALSKQSHQMAWLLKMHGAKTLKAT